MKIAFDAQLLFEKQKTGIGRTADYVIRNIIKEYDNEYYLNYFSIRNSSEKEEIVQNYNKLGYKVHKCGWFHNVIYRKIWNNISIPYTLFFGRSYEITQFFNYDIPPGVSGKAVTFIYDMVYKAFPETMSKKTLKMLDYNLEKTCKRANHIITISQFSKNEIIKYLQVPENKISIMPCGVDLSIYHTSYSEEEVGKVKEKYAIQGEYILYLGTLEPRKNIVRLIEAYFQLKRKGIVLPKLVLAGKKGWMYDTIFNTIELYKLNEYIIFTDYIEDGDIPKLLNGARIFVFPSIYEGFGLPPLEAMACGTPVIASNTASLPEIVGDAGLLVNPYSIEELASTIENLLNDELLRKNLIEKGLQRVKKFSWNQSVNRLMEIYYSLLE
ncbi:glycosyltransferase family 1 protein [Anaerocolumna sp. AGMB13025]|uniref:glycosyltransferase family 4 protein n=1 Tax=Anaerocolumna sp. AGMB13025 TaxID=3039116 RepID=UPI00241BF3BF|nr:glycosyltransferase family 1 protein [Anaerocolumna sp. AGMB13025]WFR56321.1 glycosyltransferase family 1 protein [Anaerocolumna sp. AGMB13025]